jgi:hypothetical protein
LQLVATCVQCFHNRLINQDKMIKITSLKLQLKCLSCNWGHKLQLKCFLRVATSTYCSCNHSSQLVATNYWSSDAPVLTSHCSLVEFVLSWSLILFLFEEPWSHPKAHDCT